MHRPAEGVDAEVGVGRAGSRRVAQKIASSREEGAMSRMVCCLLLVAAAVSLSGCARVYTEGTKFGPVDLDGFAR